MDNDTRVYLKGYKDGAMFALKMAWALAEDMKTKIKDGSDLHEVNEFIEKIKS